MRNLSILGCGWLGLPLAEALLHDGFAVRGSTTTAAKIPALQSRSIAAFLVEADTDGASETLTAFLQDTEILIIAFPPRFHYAKKIQSLMPYVERAGVKKVLLISSTGIFEDQQPWITEDTVPLAKTEKTHQLFTAENLLRNNPNFQTTVLRFGGLIGPNRHPVRYLAGQEGLESPEAPVNLIALPDCIGIIKAILEREVWGEVLHGVAPAHPSRMAYYTQKAQELGLVPPKFRHDRPSLGKKFDGSKLQKLLDYSFQVPDL